MSEVTIEVERRDETGKNANRRLRVQGRVPAVVYGDKKESVAIHVGTKEIGNLLSSAGGENAVFLLKMSGTAQSRHAMIRDVQADPIRGDLIHLDFQRIRMSEKVHVTVAIEIDGVPVGVKIDGGMLDFVSREVEVECLPANIPASLPVDVSELAVGSHIEAGQIPLPDGVVLLDDPNKVILSIAAARLEAEEVEDDEAGILLEAADAQPERIGGDAEE